MTLTGGGSTQAYGEAWYWDNRYTRDPSTFDWYQKYSSLAPLLRLYFPPPCHHPILVVGCGNSAFSEGMIDDGYNEVVNIDISSVVIEAMVKKYSDRPRLRYMKMDVCDMSAFGSSSFDAVIDKGTLDSLLCGNNSQENSAQMLQEVYRVLKDNGVYMLITYGSPTYRLPLLEKSCSWTIKLHLIDKLPSGSTSGSPFNRKRDLTSPIQLDANGRLPESVLGENGDVHYVYVCTKNDSGKSET